MRCRNNQHPNPKANARIAGIFKNGSWEILFSFIAAQQKAAEQKTD
jgi:hypothetical protein